MERLERIRQLRSDAGAHLVQIDPLANSPHGNIAQQRRRALGRHVPDAPAVLPTRRLPDQPHAEFVGDSPADRRPAPANRGSGSEQRDPLQRHRRSSRRATRHEARSDRPLASRSARPRRSSPLSARQGQAATRGRRRARPPHSCRDGDARDCEGRAAEPRHRAARHRRGGSWKVATRRRRPAQRLDPLDRGPRRRARSPRARRRESGPPSDREPAAHVRARRHPTETVAVRSREPASLTRRCP